MQKEFRVSLFERTKDKVNGKLMLGIEAFFSKPASYLKENWIEPMQAKHRGNYYHRRFRRVPTIDECLVDDQLCMYEANEQMKRDKMVDKQIVKHLKIRFDECRRKYQDGAQTRCYQTYEDWQNTREDFLVKWGDMPPQHSALDVYYKQVHRMIHERRQRENPENNQKSV